MNELILFLLIIAWLFSEVWAMNGRTEKINKKEKKKDD